MKLLLNVSCTEGSGNLDVTSEHLDVVPADYARMIETVDVGEEIAKRPEKFGHPVGQGWPCHSFHVENLLTYSLHPR